MHATCLTQPTIPGIVRIQQWNKTPVTSLCYFLRRSIRALTSINETAASFYARSWWGGLTVVDSARTTTIFTTWPNPTQTRTKFLQGRSLKVDWPRVLCWCCNTANLHMLSVHLYTGGLPLLRSLTKILWVSLHCCVKLFVYLASDSPLRPSPKLQTFISRMATLQQYAG